MWRERVWRCLMLNLVHSPKLLRFVCSINLTIILQILKNKVSHENDAPQLELWQSSFILNDKVTWSLAACRLVSVTQHQVFSSHVCQVSSHYEPTCTVIESLHEETSIMEELSKARKFNTHRGFVCRKFHARKLQQNHNPAYS